MERSVLAMTLRDKKRNEYLQSGTGNIIRLNDIKWSYKLFEYQGQTNEAKKVHQLSGQIIYNGCYKQPKTEMNENV